MGLLLSQYSKNCNGVSGVVWCRAVHGQGVMALGPGGKKVSSFLAGVTGRVWWWRGDAVGALGCTCSVVLTTNRWWEDVCRWRVECQQVRASSPICDTRHCEKQLRGNAPRYSKVFGRLQLQRWAGVQQLSCALVGAYGRGCGASAVSVSVQVYLLPWTIPGLRTSGTAMRTASAPWVSRR